MNTREERVRLGIAEVLDVEFPDWTTRIDLERLNTSSSQDCVLGQLHRGHFFGYWREMQERHPGWDIRDRIAWMAAHGFSAIGSQVEVDELTEAWKQAIAALRG